MPRILFVLRHRDKPWGHYPGYHLSSGLRNSVRFLVDLLELLDIEAKWVEVPDNNSIDREVTAYRPTHCIIEAFWVVPEKFDVLKRLHPHVHWAVRNHSETSFLANEGMSFGWIAGYLQRGVEIMCNAPRSVVDIQAVSAAYGYGPNTVSYAPNYYPIVPRSHIKPHHAHADDTVRIGCFGAIRPLKNQLAQGIAALRFAAKLGKKLEFYINSSRVELQGNAILNNMRALFAASKRAKLVEVGWLDHDKFLDLLQTMDFSMQVSFTETFNIVSADSVVCSVPVIASNEVTWLSPQSLALTTSTTSMLDALLLANAQPRQARLQQQWTDLNKYNAAAQNLWADRFSA